MAKVFIEETTLTAIGDAIRGKTGKTDLIDPANMSTEIAGIEAGGGGDLPAEAFIFSGDCSYKFSGSGWNWFLDMYGSRITTSNLRIINNMFFNNSSIKSIPFTLNITADSDWAPSNLTHVFSDVDNLEVCPQIRGVINWKYSGTSLEYLVYIAPKLRYLDDLLTPEMTAGYQNYLCTSTYSVPNVSRVIQTAQSLRKMPDWFYNFKLNPESTTFPSYMYGIYYSLVGGCYVLDEIKNIPVWHCRGSQTDNMFNSAFEGCWRLQSITFETNSDGTSIKTNWKNQTIDLSGGWSYRPVGYGQGMASANVVSSMLNTGITSDKEVKDDATYQALKNDPDWFTDKVEYCRYNHDSAVETINSLPDTSAYLASAGGTNTIKFGGTAGSLTDGGAINTLTEEEIAVATAKGWTVTLA